MDTLTLEHIDPRNGVLVCGLCVPHNEILADRSYNSRKTNRFVPYRVCTHSAPTTFGDVAEFLIGGSWVVCEFGGPEWWAESNRVGNVNTVNGNNSISILHSHPNTMKTWERAGERSREMWNDPELRPELSRKITDHNKEKWSDEAYKEKNLPHLAAAGLKGRDSTIEKRGTKFWLTKDGTPTLFKSKKGFERETGIPRSTLKRLLDGHIKEIKGWQLYHPHPTL